MTSEQPLISKKRFAVILIWFLAMMVVFVFLGWFTVYHNTRVATIATIMCVLGGAAYALRARWLPELKKFADREHN